MEIENLHAKLLKAIPKMKLNFFLQKFRVSLIDKEGNGVQWYSNGFKVNLQLFDSSNKYNPKTMDVTIIN